MNKTIPAVVVRAPGGPAAVEDVQHDAPGPGEILVRMLASGVCHSDLHAMEGNFGKEFPYCLGHEATAVVEALGPGVEKPAVGERVMLNWRAPCGACPACVAGDAVGCWNPRVARSRLRTKEGTPLGRILGLSTFCTHTLVDAGQAVPLADGLAPEATALIGCAVATGVGAAINTARVRPGDTVCVIGCGAVGVSVIQGARLSHASRIIAVDRVARKLELARSFGATDVIDARELKAGEVGKRVRALSPGGVHHAFEVVGLPETVAEALGCCAPGGNLVLIGVPTPKAEVTLPLARLFFSRVTVRSSHYGDCLPQRDFPRLAALYREGALPLDGLVSERIKLDEVPRAFEAMKAGEVLRSVIVF